jgi:hypothetical protein
VLAWVLTTAGYAFREEPFRLQQLLRYAVKHSSASCVEELLQSVPCFTSGLQRLQPWHQHLAMAAGCTDPWGAEVVRLLLLSMSPKQRAAKYICNTYKAAFKAGQAAVLEPLLQVASQQPSEHVPVLLCAAAAAGNVQAWRQLLCGGNHLAVAAPAAPAVARPAAAPAASTAAASTAAASTAAASTAAAAAACSSSGLSDPSSGSSGSDSSPSSDIGHASQQPQASLLIPEQQTRMWRARQLAQADLADIQLALREKLHRHAWLQQELDQLHVKSKKLSEQLVKESDEQQREQLLQQQLDCTTALNVYREAMHDGAPQLEQLQWELLLACMQVRFFTGLRFGPLPWPLPVRPSVIGREVRILDLMLQTTLKEACCSTSSSISSIGSGRSSSSGSLLMADVLCEALGSQPCMAQALRSTLGCLTGDQIAPLVGIQQWDRSVLDDDRVLMVGAAKLQLRRWLHARRLSPPQPPKWGSSSRHDEVAASQQAELLYGLMHRQQLQQLLLPRPKGSRGGSRRPVRFSVGRSKGRGCCCFVAAGSIPGLCGDAE